MPWTEEDRQRFERECQAPEGTIWVCGACGKSSKDRLKMADEACFLNAVLCYEKTDPKANWRAVESAEGGA